jgi:hypothetical protein
MLSEVKSAVQFSVLVIISPTQLQVNISPTIAGEF